MSPCIHIPDLLGAQTPKRPYQRKGCFQNNTARLVIFSHLPPNKDSLPLSSTPTPILLLLANKATIPLYRTSTPIFRLLANKATIPLYRTSTPTFLLPANKATIPLYTPTPTLLLLANQATIPLRFTLPPNFLLLLNRATTRLSIPAPSFPNKVTILPSLLRMPTPAQARPLIRMAPLPLPRQAHNEKPQWLGFQTMRLHALSSTRMRRKLVQTRMRSSSYRRNIPPTAHHFNRSSSPLLHLPLHRSKHHQVPKLHINYLATADIISLSARDAIFVHLISC